VRYKNSKTESRTKQQLQAGKQLRQLTQPLFYLQKSMGSLQERRKATKRTARPNKHISAALEFCLDSK